MYMKVLKRSLELYHQRNSVTRPFYTIAQIGECLLINGGVVTFMERQNQMPVQLVLACLWNSRQSADDGPSRNIDTQDLWEKHRDFPFVSMENCWMVGLPRVGLQALYLRSVMFRS